MSDNKVSIPKTIIVVAEAFMDALIIFIACYAILVLTHWFITLELVFSLTKFSLGERALMIFFVWVCWIYDITRTKDAK